MANFSISLNGSRLLLSGDIYANDGSDAQMAQVLSDMPPGSYVVDAQNLTLDPDVVTMWIQAVQQKLSRDHELHYVDSQLSMVLQYDARYNHPSSFFPDGNVVDTSMLKT